MSDTWKAFLAPTPQALKFALKTLLAGGLALWLAFRFDLQQPQWALMTVFAVSQPLSGMVVAKGLFRLLGTLVGTLMAVLMIALFAQTPWLFLLAIALWLGLCTAASTSLRNHVSYAFVLAGYTVAIIGLPAINHPLLVFDQAIARATEICLGIVCAALSSALLWPQRVEQSLEQQARLTWLAGMQAAKTEISSATRETRGLLSALGKIIEVDVQRDHAWFEGHRGRQRARALQVLSRDLLSLLRTARGVARQRNLLTDEDIHRLQPWLEQVAAQLQQPDSQAMANLSDRLWLASADECESRDLRYCLARCSVLILKAISAEQTLKAVAGGELPASAPGNLSWHRDWLLALFYGLRSTVALLGLAAFWLATGWPAASGAILMAAIICSLFANRDNAVAIGLGFLRGSFYAFVPAVVVTQWLLPQWTGFPLLCLALGVPLFFATLGMAKPALVGTATAVALQFITLAAPGNQMHYDFAVLLNGFIGTLIGVGFAVLVFRLLALPTNWFNRRLLALSCADLARLTQRPVAQAESWFGGRMADRLLRLARHYQLLPESDQQHWDDGLLAMDLGNELIHLRTCLNEARGGLRKERDRFLTQLGQLFEAGPACSRARQLGEISQHLDAALQQAPSEAHRLAQAALIQLTTTWQQWCQREDKRGIA